MISQALSDTTFRESPGAYFPALLLKFLTLTICHNLLKLLAEETGIEPACLSTSAFKAGVLANCTTLPKVKLYKNLLTICFGGGSWI